MPEPATDDALDVADLRTEAAILLDIVETMDRALADGPTIPRADVDALVEIRQVIWEAGRSLDLVRAALDTLIGDAMREHQVTVEGVGVVKRHLHKVRTRWDSDALLGAVLASRLVDEETGEIAAESPLAKVRDVWRLGAPRLTAVRKRGIDPDEYAEVERKGGWKLEVIT